MATEPSKQPQGDDAPQPPAADQPSVEDLADQLRSVIDTGLEHTTPDTLRALFALQCVQDRARAADALNDDGLTHAARDVIRGAIDSLGEGTYGQAARRLFGASDDTRHQALRDRRRQAAYALDVLPDWLRRHYEPQLAQSVADGIYRAEHPPSANASSADTPAGPADVTTITRAAPKTADDQHGGRSWLRRVVRWVHPPDDETSPVVLTSLSAPHPLTTSQPPQADLDELRDQRATKQWRVVIVIGGLIVLVRYGLDAIPRYVLVLAILGLAKTATDIAIAWAATRTLGFHGWWPRVLMLTATAFAAGVIVAGQDDNDNGDAFPNCQFWGVGCEPQRSTTTETTTATSAPTTTIPTRSQPAPTECPPPQGGSERRISFLNVPPMCINPNAQHIATITTSNGAFEIALNTRDARWTVNNFAYLANWRFYEGIELEPTDTYIVVGDPIETETNSQIPGYTLTFERTSYPPLDPLDVYVIATDSQYPNRWAIAVTNEELEYLHQHPELGYPLLGRIRCGAAAITDENLGDLTPAMVPNTITIQTVTIRELPANEHIELRPRRNCQ